MSVDFSAEREALRAEAACFDQSCEPFANMTGDRILRAIGEAIDAGDLRGMMRAYLHHWAQQPDPADGLELATSLIVSMRFRRDPDLAAWASDNPLGIIHQLGAGRRHFPDDEPQLGGLTMLDIVELAENKADSFAEMVLASPFVRKLVEDSQARADEIPLD